jgi:hypothetical protein
MNYLKVGDIAYDNRLELFYKILEIKKDGYILKNLYSGKIYPMNNPSFIKYLYNVDYYSSRTKIRLIDYIFIREKNDL